MAAPFNYDQPYIIVGALIERDGKFLLLQENHAPNQGLWNIPSGKLDFGESPLTCVRREAQEEAGLQFQPTAIVSLASIYRQDVGADQTGRIHAFRIMYSGTTAGDISFSGNEIDTAGRREISQHRWLTPAEIADPNLRLRYTDIPAAVHNYLAGHTLPLEAVSHIVQPAPTKSKQSRIQS
jgi:ADP-ribose pyrophosphatase YjhB (NUDIX family)